MEGDERTGTEPPLLSLPLPDVQWGTITGGKPGGWVREGERRGKAAARCQHRFSASSTSVESKEQTMPIRLAH